MTPLHTLFHGKSFGKSFCSCAPSPPPTPDYQGAAQAQGQANIDAAKISGQMNNPNVIGPYGNQTVTWNGNQPTITQTLSPQQQQILDKGNQAKIGMTDLAIQGTNAAKGVIGTPLDLSGLPAAPGSADATRAKVMDAMMARINEDSDRQKDITQSNLLAAGIPSSSKAYADAMALQDRTRTDAANQAYLASGQEASRDYGMDEQSRKDALAEQLTQRQTPLNEITALMSGSQVSNPFSTPGYAQNANVQAAPLFAAQNAAADYNTDVYNTKAAQAGNLQKGLFGLGTAGMMTYSDRRLKSNIVRLADHPLGIGWYEYDIDGRREQGVMAQELLDVKPEAVGVHRDGYLTVDYSQIGRIDA